MVINPYEPRQRSVDGTHGASGHASRVRFAGVGGGLAAFGIGIVWIKVLRRTPTDVDPVTWTLAQIVAFGGIAIVVVGVVGQICTSVSALVARSPKKEKIVWGWNSIPAACSVFVGIAWCALACFGVYLLAVELVNWDFYRGLPILEIVLQSLLYASGLAAGGCCMIAALRWMQENYRLALMNTLIGIFGPIVAFILLFAVCDDLIRYIV